MFTNVEEKLTVVIDEVCKCTKEINRSEALYMNCKTIEKVKRGDGIILVVQMGKTTYAQIERELENCKEYGISVRGGIAIY